jgi:hypothetical protein
MSTATCVVTAASSADRHIPAAEALRRYPSLSRARLYRLVVGNEVRVIRPRAAVQRRGS